MAECPYRLELAKSGRSTCVASKEPIEKGELRFGTLVLMGGKGSYKWRKLACITAKQVANIKTSLGGPEKVDGYEELSAEQQAAVIKAFEAAAAPTAAPGSSPDDGSPPVKKARRGAKVVEPTGLEGSKSSASSSCSTPPPAGDASTPPKPAPDLMEAAHKLIDMAKDGAWAAVYEALNLRPELIDVRPEVREYTALHQAAFLGNDAAVLALLDLHGADPNLCTRTGKTAADVALEQGHDKVAALLAGRVKCRAATGEMLTPEKVPMATASTASVGPRSAPTLAADAPEWQAVHKLIDLARDAHWEELYSVLDVQPELVNLRPSVREYSVLHQAAFHGCEKVVNILIDKYGADLELESKYGEKALGIARAHGHKSLVKLLSPPEPADAVEEQAEDEDFDMVQMPDGSWKVITKTREEAPPAAATGHVTPIPALTAEVVQAAHKLIDLARDASWEEVFLMLDEHRELVNVRPVVREYSVLHQAAWYGDEEAVAALMNKYGADAKLLSKLGKSVVEVAKEQGHEQLLGLLS